MDGDIKLFDEFDWTPERDRQMLELRQTGMTIADMAAQMCCSKRKLIYRLEVLKPPRIKHPTWTDERDEYLREHYPAGVKTGPGTDEKPGHRTVGPLGVAARD